MCSATAHVGAVRTEPQWLAAAEGFTARTDGLSGCNTEAIDVPAVVLRERRTHVDRSWQRRMGRPADDFATFQGAIVGPDRVVIWVDLALPRYPEQTAEYKAVLLGRAQWYPNLVVGAWDELSIDGEMHGDLVHYAKAGYERRAAAYVDWLLSAVER
jgi:hypothetical protein